MLINKKIISFCLMAMMAFFVVSCDDDDPINNQPHRLFRPGSFSRLVEGTTVTLSWTPIKNATYYIEYGRAEAGTDFGDAEDMQALTLGRVSSHVLENLWGETRYAIRIKAVSLDPAIEDSEYVYSNFTTGAENIFYPLTYEMDGSNFRILVKWEAGQDVTHVEINNLQLGTKVIPLSGENIATGELVIENDPEYRLRAGQQYTVSIYLNERKRGSNSVTLQRS